MASYTYAGLPVPYITRWEHERTIFPDLINTPGRVTRLGFADESMYDRDSHDVLWLRQTLQPGKGRAVFEDVHALRQRRAVLDLLCQICGVPTYQAERQLWVVAGAGGVPIREDEVTSSPPVCPPCAPKAIQYCPRLRRGHAAAWVRRPYGWGVEAFLFEPGTLRAISKEPQQIRYEDPMAPWAVAYRALTSLRECTPVDIRELDTSG
ncbi:hypothetical protein [Streptomyces sp. NPDC048057]|uniref:hypothetical protein n=1 Tax=Streptomyces sp. NPDC048057 TaxID=3155628 RepID=UPI0033FCF28C